MRLVDQISSSGLPFAIDSKDVSVTPNGNITSTSVQNTLNELDTKKQQNIVTGASAEFYSGGKTMIAPSAVGYETIAMSNSTSAYLKNYIDIRPGQYAGPITTVTITDAGSGNVSFNACTAKLFDNSTFQNGVTNYSVASAAFQLTDKIYYYLTIQLSGSSAYYKLETVESVINYSNIIGAGSLSFQSSINETYMINFGSYGLGLPNKTSHRLIAEGIKWDSGLTLTTNLTNGTRNIQVSNGTVWVDSEMISLLSHNSLSANNYVHLVTTNSTGGWNYQQITQYDNTHYDTGTGSGTVSNKQYVLNWVYKPIDITDKCVFILLGTTSSLSYADALVSQPPLNVPDLITKQCILVGRIAVLEGTNTTYTQSTIRQTFSGSVINTHNNLDALQGGDAVSGNYYHLDLATYNNIYGTTANVQTQLNNLSTVKANKTTTIDGQPLSSNVTISGTTALTRLGAATATSLDIESTLSYPGTSGSGVRLGLAIDAYGWMDLFGYIRLKTATTTTNPTYAAYDGTLFSYQFGTNATVFEVFSEYHMTHDYLLRSPMYIHTHWSTITSDLNNCVWWWDIIYANGYQRGSFSTPITISKTLAGSGAFVHSISEELMATPGGLVSSATNVSITSGQTTLTAAAALWTAADIGRTIRVVGAGAAGGNLDTTITAFASSTSVTVGNAAGTTVTTLPRFNWRIFDSNNLEVDGMFMVRTYRQATNAADTLAVGPFLHFIDIHYQSTGVMTPNRNYPFYN